MNSDPHVRSDHPPTMQEEICGLTLTAGLLRFLPRDAVQSAVMRKHEKF